MTKRRNEFETFRDEIEIIAARLDSIEGLALHLSKVTGTLDDDDLQRVFCAIAASIRHEIEAIDTLVTATYQPKVVSAVPIDTAA